MADLSFDPYLGWVNITDPNNIPEDARTVTAEDLLRYEQLGVDVVAKVNEHDARLDEFDSDEAVAISIGEPDSSTRAAVQSMVDQGVEDFQAVIDTIPAQVDAQLATDVPPAVAIAIAADTSIVAATVAAVDAEIAGRDLAEMPELLEDDIAFAVVDEDGRRLWLEAGYDGRPTDYAAGLITEKIGPAITADVEDSLGMEDMSTAVTGLAFVVVDEGGRKTEIEIAEDGRFTQRVVDSIASRLAYPTPPADTSVQVISPSTYSMVVGKTYKLYASDYITALSEDHTVLTPGVVGNYGGYWQYTPAAPASFTLTVKVVDRLAATVVSKAIPVTAYAAPSGAGKRHLAIGDSITRAGNYSYLAANAIPGMTAVGTRTYNDALFATEGRGGWSLSSYFNNIGAAAADSPFLFPTAVANGAKFWGNTEFWRKVSWVAMNTLPTNGYDYDGFQKMARNWGSMASSPVFDVIGYPNTPAEGDVVVDPTQSAGNTFRQYTSGAWVTMSPQPSLAGSTVAFSFSKYMQRFAAAYPNGGPTSISIMLETNDFFTTLDDSSWATWKGRMDTVIASVRAWSATVPFIICLAPTGGPADKWGGETVQKFEFDRRIKDAAQRILAAYDTQSNRDNKVYVSSFLGAVSPANMSDYVHPLTTTGHEDMSAPLAGTLAKLITEGA
jgi:hypothetical protein